MEGVIIVFGIPIKSPIGSSKRVAALPFVRALFPRSKQDRFASPSAEFLELLWREHTINQLIQQQHAKQGSVSRDLKQQQVEMNENVDKAVGKQFRRASMRVHPDRVDKDKETAAAFDALGLAYEYLKDSITRREYMQAMLIPQPGSISSPEFKHKVWVAQQEEAKTHDSERSRYHQAMATAHLGAGENGTMVPLQIEGGWRGKKPRHLLVSRADAMHKTVFLQWAPLSPVIDFQDYCTTAYIVINEEAIIEIHRDELESLYETTLGFYGKTIRLPDWGSFSLTWYAKLLVDGSPLESVQSDPIEINLLHPSHERALEERTVWIQMAQQETGRLHKETASRRISDAFWRNRSEIKHRQKNLHRALGNAQLIIRKICKICDKLDEDESSCPELLALRQAVKKATTVQASLAEALSSLDEKITRKSFVHSLEDMIEAGKAVSWLSEVSNQELDNFGVDANRVFQLLIEGKKGISLFSDPDVLMVASRRVDLFSAKQCKALSQRYNEVEAHREAEIEHMLEPQALNEAAKPIEVEPERTEILPSDALAGFKEHSFVSETTPPGTFVTIESESSVAATGVGPTVPLLGKDHVQLASTSPHTVALSDGDIFNATTSVHTNHTLLKFLQSQSDCLKCSAEAFCKWLSTRDVDSLMVLSEAVNDEGFIDEMQSNGIKGFKRMAFKKNLAAASTLQIQSQAQDHVAKASTAAAAYKTALLDYLSRANVSHETFSKIDLYAPEELQCSISTCLMVVDPVVATDGYTYERHEIEAWMATQIVKGELVTSPRTNQVLSDLSLSPNISARNMAREFVSSESQKTWSQV